MSKLALMFPHVVAGFRRRKLRLQTGASAGNTMPSFEQVFINQDTISVFEKVWPQGSELRHPVAHQLIARLEAAPPEAARQMATVI
ncbi:MAG: hypothetical protein IJT88_00820 [Kiritimatiellae bacterium]|nr:hypothetical protein [Kiritimatiellia bacterium]